MSLKPKPSSPKRQKTVLEHVLLGLVPYTRENFALTFKPHVFFGELERISGHDKKSLKAAYYRARSRGYLAEDGNVVRLTRDGERAILPFQATKLGGGARLLVMFDIPQRAAVHRQILRRFLKKQGFAMVQQSVWMSDMDYRQALIELVRELELVDYVEIHESVKLYPE